MMSSSCPRHVLMVFVDGLGVPDADLAESIYAHCPTLTNLINNHSVSLDACLGIEGFPQSATGQTAILTGVNAAQVIGEHWPGFPSPDLRDILRDNNLFVALQSKGVEATFANAYLRKWEGDIPLSRQSATTVSTLAAFGCTRTLDHMLAGEAVYHDLTRVTADPQWLGEAEHIHEKDAAAHLLAVTRSVQFCLFEYFLTDWVGHRGTAEEKRRVLTSLDIFLEGLLAGMDMSRELLLVVSDHGNIEDESRRGHSKNRVPWIARGCGEELARQSCTSLVDVTPAVLRVMVGGEG